MQVLVVDDERRLADLIARGLRETDLRSNVIDVYIASLRAKVDKPFGRHAIETLRGAGYRLEPGGG